MRESNSMFNTHILTVKGLISVYEGEIIHPRKGEVDIRCTSNSNGETLSVTYKNVQIAVKVKDIEKIINEARDSIRS